MTRHLVELGVSIQVWRNQWGQVIIDLKCPEAHPEIRVNNVVQPEAAKDAPALQERITLTEAGQALADRIKCGND